jgi:hypothetical protein
MLKTNIDEQFKALAAILKDQFPKVVMKAEKDALRRTSTAMQTQAKKRIPKKLTLKKKAGGSNAKISEGAFKKEFTKRGVELKGLRKSFAYVVIFGRRVSASRYEFIPKNPPRQKGIRPDNKGDDGGKVTYSKRKRIIVKPFRASSGTTYKTSFIFRDRSGELAVGQRRDPVNKRRRSDGQKTELHVQKLALPGPGAMVEKDAQIKKSILAAGQARFRERFPKRVKFFAQKEIQRRLKANIKRGFK